MNNDKKTLNKNEGSFSGGLGFVLAAAGSAVGLGNIWRFPYLAARDGGGLFLIIYLILAFTFGFTMLTTDIAIGRHTKKSPIKAFSEIKKHSGFIGVIAFIIPVIIMTYYGVIGGWIVKYIVGYISGDAAAMAGDDYFGGFITSVNEPVIFMLIFLFATAVIVFLGVDKGIEASSKIIMPVLIVLTMIIAIYALTLKHTDESGITRTGLEGLKVYLIPSLDGITVERFIQILLDAMMQLFYSLSVSMGIMITYGSYVKDEVDLNKSINQIELFDTGIALLAGMAIIPSIYAFSGTEGMGAGPSLLFVALPKVFSSMGKIGIAVGIMFFIMVSFAALSSCVSILETITADVMQLTKMSRKKTAVILFFIYAALSIIVCLGYNKLYFDIVLPNSAHAQILDVADYISNSIMMPVVSLITSILIGWIVGPGLIKEEMEKGNVTFRRYKIYYVMIKFIVPVIMLVLTLQAFGLLDFLG